MVKKKRSGKGLVITLEDVYKQQAEILKGQQRIEKKVDNHITKDENDQKWTKRWLAGLSSIMGGLIIAIAI